jgi:hypothetical protein
MGQGVMSCCGRRPPRNILLGFGGGPWGDRHGGLLWGPTQRKGDLEVLFSLGWVEVGAGERGAPERGVRRAACGVRRAACRHARAHAGAGSGRAAPGGDRRPRGHRMGWGCGRAARPRARVFVAAERLLKERGIDRGWRGPAGALRGGKAGEAKPLGASGARAMHPRTCSASGREQTPASPSPLWGGHGASVQLAARASTRPARRAPAGRRQARGARGARERGQVKRERRRAPPLGSLASSNAAGCGATAGRRPPRACAAAAAARCGGRGRVVKTGVGPCAGP